MNQIGDSEIPVSQCRHHHSSISMRLKYWMSRASFCIVKSLQPFMRHLSCLSLHITDVYSQAVTVSVACHTG